MRIPDFLSDRFWPVSDLRIKKSNVRNAIPKQTFERYSLSVG